MTDPKSDEVALTVKDAATRVGLHPVTFRRRVLPHLAVVRLSTKTVLVPVRELDRWVEKNATRE